MWSPLQKKKDYVEIRDFHRIYNQINIFRDIDYATTVLQEQ